MWKKVHYSLLPGGAVARQEVTFGWKGVLRAHFERLQAGGRLLQSLPVQTLGVGGEDTGYSTVARYAPPAPPPPPHSNISK